MRSTIYTTLIFQIVLISLSACENCWKAHWEKGLYLYYQEKYQDAREEFDHALVKMSEEDQILFPFVLVSRAENDYLLQDYSRVMRDTEKALESANLTDYEQLQCGLKRISIYMKMGDEDSAIEEYKKYIIGCHFFPKIDYFKDKIIIRNIPDCQHYKDCTKQKMLSQYCLNEKDINEYGNTWIINITKTCNCEENQDNWKVQERTSSNFSLKEIQRNQGRTESEIQACCNTCNRLAVAANAICACLPPPPPQFGGPITQRACQFACVMFVEQLRQDCEFCCRNGNSTCPKTFETWKLQFKKENPDCPCPPKQCS